MLSKEQVQYLNGWYNYFRDIAEQGGGNPPSYNQEDIAYWNKWYKEINKQAKVSKSSAVPFSNTQPVIKKRRVKQLMPTTTGINPVQYEVQQESNYSPPATL